MFELHLDGAVSHFVYKSHSTPLGMDPRSRSRRAPDTNTPTLGRSGLTRPPLGPSREFDVSHRPTTPTPTDWSVGCRIPSVRPPTGPRRRNVDPAPDETVETPFTSPVDRVRDGPLT